MRKIAAASVFALLLAASAAAPAVAARPRGSLIIIGGGERAEVVMRRFVDLARAHATGRIVVFTMASGVPEETGPELIAELRAAGAAVLSRHHLTREQALKPEAAALLDGAGGVFFSGGDQSRVTEALLDTPVHEALLKFYEAGGTIGGTSAGAAIMSEVMITGDERRKPAEGREWQTIEAGNVVTVRGLGFVRNAIVDQHFLVRRRHNRLLSVVLEHPDLLGLAIDEDTAVVVRPDGTWEVAGPGQVLVIDARKAAVTVPKTGLLGGRGLVLHILLSGDVYDPASGRVTSRPFGSAPIRIRSRVPAPR